MGNGASLGTVDSLIVTTGQNEDPPSEPLAPFESWGWHGGTTTPPTVCAVYHQKGQRVALSNRAKALDHWAAGGSGKDPCATIKDCPFAHTALGLREHARAQNKVVVVARRGGRVGAAAG